MAYTHEPILKLRNLFNIDEKKFKINILSVKRITKFNDSFFRIKLYSLNFNHPKFHIVDVTNGNIKFFLRI